METQEKVVTEQIVLPAHEIPGFRIWQAIQRGVEKNLLFATYGGIGDVICAEPTLRYAINNFKGCNVSLATELPELFSHLKFERVYNLKKEHPDLTKYLVLKTTPEMTPVTMIHCIDFKPVVEINRPHTLHFDFMTHMLINCVDFPAIAAYRSQLPVKDREIQLPHELPPELPRNAVVVHAGRHWSSKTFPANWWNEVLRKLIELELKPVLIGKEMGEQGYVKVDAIDCIDYRDELSLLETIGLLKKSPVLITSDSGPYHMAAASDAFIGCIATVKHPDYLKHWRKGQFGWREKFLNKGGYWDVLNPSPQQKQDVKDCTPELMSSWLPEPEVVANWAQAAHGEFYYGQT